MGIYSDDSLRSYIEKNKRISSLCVYCGNDADSREHLPSKVFIDIPYPEEHPIVPACTKCNNGFSVAELYVSCFVDRLRNALSKNDIPLRSKTIKALEHDKQLATLLDNEVKWSDNKLYVSFNNEYIMETLIKLAKGHLCNRLDKVFEKTVSVKCVFYFKPDLLDEQLSEFNEMPFINKAGEVGCDFSHSIIIFKNIETGETDAFCPWEEFQDGNYRYMAYFDEAEYIVKIIIDEILFARITIPKG